MSAAATGAVSQTEPQIRAAPASNRQRIVFISGIRIFPNNTGGHVRSGGIARSLARLGHEVRIHSLAGRQSDYRLSALTRQSYRVDEIAPDLCEETNLGLGYGALQTLGRRLDYPRVWQHAAMRRGLVPGRLKAALQRADIVFYDFPWCPPVPGPWSRKPRILISHNLEHRLLEQGDRRHRRFSAWMREVESRAPLHYDDVLACAEEDREFFRRHDPSGRLRVPLVRCGVDPQAYAVPEGTRARVRAELGLTEDDKLLVFSASGHGPNLEALASLREFCEAEQAFLQSERLHVLVLGSVVPTPYRAGALIATGRVPEVAPYLAAADAGLNAVMRGSGANIKLFEYLAARLPVISTRFGARGSELEPDADFLLYEPDSLKAVLRRFARERSRAEWRSHAEAVWVRHRRSCDVEEMVRAAVGQLAAFGAAAVTPR